MRIQQYLVSQFKRPHGLLGELAGYTMSSRPSNIRRNQWTLELLDLQHGDHLLEVGFGPGLAIENALQLITDGLIVGIDHSNTMLMQASKRNKLGIQQGKINLYLGSVETLPVTGRLFNKIMSANVVQFWKDPVTTFKILRSLMVEGGMIATTYMPRHRGATSIDTLKKSDEIIKQLKLAGFTEYVLEELKMEPVSAISVLAKNV